LSCSVRAPTPELRVDRMPPLTPVGLPG
jgi:hypothetical protein